MCRLSYFTLVCLWCGRVVERAGGRAYGHVIAKFSRMGRLLHFLTHAALLRELRYNQLSFLGEFKKFVPYCWRFRTEARIKYLLRFCNSSLKATRFIFF